MPKSDKILIAVVLIISAAILLSNSNGVLASGSKDLGGFDRSFEVTGPVQLNIENSSGAINIRRGTAGKVEIHAQVRGNNWFGNSEEQARRVQENPPVEQSGNTIRIHKPEPNDFFNRISISYDVSVPEETTVNSTTGSGAQTVASVKGPVALRSGSGSVNVTDVGSQTEATTGSGSITLQSVNGPVRVQTGSGSVRADGIAGAFRGSTGSGSIELRQTAPGDVEAKTGSGRIRLENISGGVTARAGSGSITVSGRPSGRWEMQSGSGSIDMKVPNDAGLDLYARTHSGRINVGPPITIESGQADRREIRGKVRGGGTLVELTTGSGSINLE